jgi:hypothetical protein
VRVLDADGSQRIVMNCRPDIVSRINIARSPSRRDRNSVSSTRLSFTLIYFWPPTHGTFVQIVTELTRDQAL